MRSRFLFSICSLTLAIVVLSSCIKSEDNDYAYSIDASVRAFSIDSINGVKYPFSIDLMKSAIYNKDSLPYLSDTLLKSFKIDTFSVSGFVTAADTIMSFPATIDLTKAMNGANGIMFTVYAADGQTTRNYLLDVRVHQQDPDSLMWGQRTDIPQSLRTAELGDNFKMLELGSELYIFDGNAQSVFHTATGDGTSYAWQEDIVYGLPDNVVWDNALTFKDKFYANTADGQVYSSANGLTWNKAEALGSGVKALLTGMTERLLAIQTIDGKDYFCYTEGDASPWTTGKEVPSDFPTRQIQSTVYTTPTGVEKATITGMPLSHDTAVVPWFTFEGDDWAALSTEEMYCPAMDHPTIISYDSYLFIFGSKFENVYVSPSALTWEAISTKFLLPKELNGKEVYSSVVDQNHHIWIIVSDAGNNQLWRGRVNKFGFKRQ